MRSDFLAAQNTPSIASWVTTLGELAALKPAKVAPSHGVIGDTTLVARDCEFLQASRVASVP